MKLKFLMLLITSLFSVNCLAIECNNWQALHPDWLWCDDFENDSSLNSDYFEVNRRNGFGVTHENSFDGSGSLKATYIPGISESGNVKFSFGKTPVAPTRYTDQNFDDIYWRFYVMHEPGWVGNPGKLTRAIIFAKSDWSQAAIGHIWKNNSLGLKIEPVSGVSGNTVMTEGYNDFPNMSWLGGLPGKTEIFEPGNIGKWFCIEVHMALNSLNNADGVLEFWINDELQSSRNDLNLRGGYDEYGINAIFLENYANGGMEREQSRYMDNFVVSQKRINCNNDPTTDISPPKPPKNVTAE